MRKTNKFTKKQLKLLSEAILNEGRKNFERRDTGEALNGYMSYLYNLRKIIEHLNNSNEVRENDVRKHDFRSLYNAICNEIPSAEQYYNWLKNRYNF